MEQTIDILCPRCNSKDIRKNGCQKNKDQRYLCTSCWKHFQMSYKYKANEIDASRKIEELALNGLSGREIARNLGISKDTVLSHLKKKS